MPTVSCPSCDRALEVEPTYRDWTVRCPHCATEFVPSEAAPEVFEREDRRASRRDNPDDYDRPRRRRRDDPERDRREAADVVYGPGLWLELCGWAGGLLLLGGAGFWFLVANGAKNNPNGNGDGGAILFGLLSALCALPYAIAMIAGGRKMRNLSGYGWAMTASIVGIGSFMLFCFVCVFAFVPVVFGIWGVVALNNPVVARAFDRPAEDLDFERWDD